jgi:hypothetical protein
LEEEIGPTPCQQCGPTLWRSGPPGQNLLRACHSARLQRAHMRVPPELYQRRPCVTTCRPDPIQDFFPILIAPKLPHPDHHSGPDHAPKFPCASTLTPKADRVRLRFDRGSRRPDHVHTKEISHHDSVDVAHVLPMLPTCPYPLREATPRQIFSLPIAIVSLRISLMPLLRHAALEAAGVSCTETQVPKRLPQHRVSFVASPKQCRRGELPSHRVDGLLRSTSGLTSTTASFPPPP